MPGRRVRVGWGFWGKLGWKKGNGMGMGFRVRGENRNAGGARRAWRAWRARSEVVGR